MLDPRVKASVYIIDVYNTKISLITIKSNERYKDIVKRNQKGFSLVEILVVMVVIGLIGSAGWCVWQSRHRLAHNGAAQNIPTQTVPQFTAHLGVGSHALTLRASDRILLPSGAILYLPKQDTGAVPEFSYDSSYRNRTNKQLAVITKLDVYHNGYRYKITKGDCNSLEKTFNDYTQVVVTDCTVTVDAQKSSLPILSPATIAKQYTVTEKNNPSTGPQAVLSSEPFLLVRGGNGRLTLPKNNGKPYLEANDGASVSLTIISDYGIVTVAYSAEEFTAKMEKQVEIANSTIKIKPDTITCTSAYLENAACAVVNDKFVFDVSYSRQSARNPEVIIYSLD